MGCSWVSMMFSPGIMRELIHDDLPGANDLETLCIIPKDWGTSFYAQNMKKNRIYFLLHDYVRYVELESHAFKVIIHLWSWIHIVPHWWSSQWSTRPFFLELGSFIMISIYHDFVSLCDELIHLPQDQGHLKVFQSFELLKSNHIT